MNYCIKTFMYDVFGDYHQITTCSCGFFGLGHLKTCPICGVSSINEYGLSQSNKTGHKKLFTSEITSFTEEEVVIAYGEVEFELIKVTQPKMNCSIKIHKEISGVYKLTSRGQETITQSDGKNNISDTKVKKIMKNIVNLYLVKEPENWIKLINNSPVCDCDIHLYRCRNTLVNHPAIEVICSTYPELIFSPRNILNCIDETQTKASKILGLSKKTIRTLIEKQINYTDFKKRSNEFGEEQTLENWERLNEVSCSVNDLMFFLDKGYKLSKILSYLTFDVIVYQSMNSVEARQFLYDYIQMCEDIEAPFDKYPRDLRLCHDIAVKNHKISLDEEAENNFMKVVSSDEYTELALEGDEYSVICPEKSIDIVREGQNLHHSVASYIDRIINGGNQIYFLRKTKQLDKSVLTLEVIDNTLVQYRGAYNRSPNEKEMKAIMGWVKATGLDFIEQQEY